MSFFLYQIKFQEDRGGIFILYRLCKRKQFEDRFELEFKPLTITDSDTVANRLALVLILDVICSPWANSFHCGNEGRRKAGGRLSTMPGHGRPPNAHHHSSWGHQGTLHVVSPVFYTPHHSVFNPHGDSLVPSPFSLNPYHLLSQSSFQVTVLLSRH